MEDVERNSGTPESRIAQYHEQMTTAVKAGRLIDVAIAKGEGFSSNEAMRLACLRLAYTTEWQCSAEEMSKVEEDLEGKDWGVSRKLGEWRLENESILSATTDGNYTPLKELLKREVEIILYTVGDGSKLDSSDSLRRKATKLSELEVTIPQKGEPFIPPSHSWEDPQIADAFDPGSRIW